MRPSIEFSDTLAAPMASEIDELAERSESLEQRVSSLNDSYEALKRREVELIERRWVLREAGGFFDRVSILSILVKEAISLANLTLVIRPMDTLMKFDNPSTTMRHPFYETSSNNTQEYKTMMPQTTNRSRLWILVLSLE